jgi:hypothetical protein
VSPVKYQLGFYIPENPILFCNVFPFPRMKVTSPVASVTFTAELLIKYKY